MNRIVVTIVAVTLFHAQKAMSQNLDSVACKKFNDTLEIVRKLVDDINSDPTLRRVSAISFLRELTRVPYQGTNISLIGPDRPSKNYYLSLMIWYEANKNRLAWDPNNEKIYLKEKTQH